MNISHKIHIIFLIAVLLASCTQESQPQLIWERYLASIQSMNNFEDRQFEEYISSRAKGVVRKKMGDVKKGQADSFLKFWKAEAVLPSESQLAIQVEQETAVLKITANNHPEQNSMQITYVNFIRENGWKIDKIIRETSSGDFNFKSTTY